MDIGDPVSIRRQVSVENKKENWMHINNVRNKTIMKDSKSNETKNFCEPVKKRKPKMSVFQLRKKHNFIATTVVHQKKESAKVTKEIVLFSILTA